jgi:SAM-dependent methyltransferase
LPELYVHFGCAFCAPPDWLNFDNSPTLRFERIPLIGTLYTKNATRFPQNVRFGDIVRGLPVPDGSCRGVYCSHVLDCLCFDDAAIALRNTRKMMAPGGIFRLVVEDCSRFMREYLADSSSAAAPRFMQATGLGRKSPSGMSDIVKGAFGRSYRQWIWDFPSLAHELEIAGFKDIRPALFGDSADSRFSSVEDKGRWDGAVGIECRA